MYYFDKSKRNSAAESAILKSNDEITFAIDRNRRNLFLNDELGQ